MLLSSCTSIILEEDEKLIWRFLKSIARKEQLDLIALHCKMPTHKIAGMLLTIELKGVICPLPEKLFEVI